MSDKGVSIAVVGAGAVGAFYGAKLQKAGHRLQYQSRFLAEHMQGNLLDIESIWKNFSLKIEAFAQTRDMSLADIIIVATKNLPDIDLPNLIRPLIKENSAIICLQNGINQEERLAKAFEHHNIIGALAFTCINREGANLIRHIDYGMLKIAPLKSETDIQEIATMFEKAGIVCELGNNLRLFRWQKLLWNVPFNPLSVVCGGVTTDLIMGNENLVTLSKCLMKEVQAIAKAEGLEISDLEIDDMIARTRKMQPYKTSMVLDYQSKKAMEVEAILLEPIKIAKNLGVPVPYINQLHAVLDFYNQANLGEQNP